MDRSLLYKGWYGLLLLPVFAFGAKGLTLSQAEAYAINHAPEIHQLQQQESAYKASAIAANAMPDPKMSVGVANLPTDSFSFTQENMTQVQVGVMESFPKGHSLAIKSAQEQLKASNSQQQQTLMTLTVLKTLRSQWLALYYWQQALDIYQKEETLFQQLTETTQAHLSNNKMQQKDAVRAQLELSQLHQKLLNAKQHIAMLQGKLSRWLGHQSLDISLPTWAAPPSLDTLETSLQTHPQLKVDQLQSAVSQKGIELAEQQYKPGVTAGVVYGLRQGDDSMGNSRSDFVGAQVSFDLPFFTANLQDQQVAASKDKYIAMQDKEQSDYQSMLSELQSTYATWQYLHDQTDLYQTKLVPQATLYAKATEVAYQNKQTDFPTLVRAYLQDYQTQLASLKMQVDALTAKVNLQYLQGKMR